MVRFWTPAGCAVSLGVLTKRYDTDAIIAELRRAMESGDQQPGQDRLTLVDPAISPDDMTLESFMRIYQVSAPNDLTPQPGERPLKSVFVTGRGRHSRGTHVYIEMRRKLPGAWVDFRIVHSVAEASAVLGVSDLSGHFADWPEMAGYLTRS